MWAVENAMKINPSKCKASRFTRARVKDPLNYSILGTLILEASSYNNNNNNNNNIYSTANGLSPGGSVIT